MKITPCFVGVLWGFIGGHLRFDLCVSNAGANAVLSWPTNVVGYTLQSTTNLTSPADWIDSTNTPAVLGARFTITNETSASRQFYRLIKP